MRQTDLVERVLAYDPGADEALLNKAYVYAMTAHGKQFRASGDPYFAHPLEVAAILTDLKLDVPTIVTALLHDTIEDTQTTVQELQGERIDIIPYNPDPATFIVNALAPAEVTKVVLDEDTHRVEVVVPDEQLSLGIGRRGQNVRLASQLTGWQIDILTEAEESERRQKEFTQRSQLFMESLDVDETVAQLLASEGFATIEDDLHLVHKTRAFQSHFFH